MLTRKKLDMTTQKTTRPLSQRLIARVNFKNCLISGVCGAITHSSPKNTYAICNNYEIFTNVISAMHLSLDGAPVRLHDMPSLRVEEQLNAWRSLSILGAAKDLVEETLINLDLASEDLLIDGVLASA